MSFSLVEVAGANFRTDEESDLLTTEFMGRLAVTKRLLPARLAIARSLAVHAPPPLMPEKCEVGKVIKGDALFGTGAALGTWTALVIQHDPAKAVDLKALMDLVARHWRRGISLLQEDWNACDQDPTRFLRRLIEVSGIRMDGTGGFGDGPEQRDDGGELGEVVLPIGEVSEDATSGEKITWAMNAPGGSPHFAIMGGVGSGKTRTAMAMLQSLREHVRVPIIAFDFKGDLGEPEDPQSRSYRLDRTFDGSTIRPPLTPVPLDVLAFSGRDDISVDYAAQSFLESFSRLKGSGVGAKQSGAVFEAARRALRANSPCRLTDILAALRDVYAERSMTEDGAIAALDEICRFPLFEAAMRPAEFFRRSWVIALPANLPERSRVIVVNLVLDALDRYLNSLPEAAVDERGNRGLRIMCLIDEAHRILGAKVPSLSSLIRQSRSKGGAVLLISQSPDDFSGEEDDFLSEMGLIAAFSTNANPTQVRRLVGQGVKLSGLKTGQCVVKRRGDPSGRVVKSY
jgi:DNA sulfur modification protein DndE